MKTEEHKDVKQPQSNLYDKCNSNINPKRFFFMDLYKMLLKSLWKKAEKNFKSSNK